MGLLRAGFVVSMIFIFLVMAPVAVLGGRIGLLHEEAVTGVSEKLSWRSRSDVASIRSVGHIGGSFSGRKMLAAEGPRNELAPTEQLDEHASTVDHSTVPSAETQSTMKAPSPPAGFASRFAFLFRGLSKGTGFLSLRSRKRKN